MLANALILAGIIFIEGIMRLDECAVVVSRTLWSGWKVVTPVHLGRGFYLVAPFSPFRVNIHLQLSYIQSSEVPVGSDSISPAVDDAIAALQIIGVTAWAVLVVALPWLIDRSGLYGAAQGVLLLGFVALQARLALGMFRRSTGVVLPSRIQWSVVWPFSAVRVAEVFARAGLATADPVAFLWRQTDRHRIARLVQKQAYDRKTDRTEANAQRDWRSELVARLGKAELAQLLSLVSADMEAGQPCCPRCGACFRPGFLRCSGCDVELTLAE